MEEEGLREVEADSKVRVIQAMTGFQDGDTWAYLTIKRKKSKRSA